MKQSRVTVASFAAALSPFVGFAACLAGALPARGADVPFAEHVISTNALIAWSVFATDLDGDGDGDTDVLSASGDKIAWYESLSPCGFDSDCDGDVDLNEFALFQEALTGP